MAIARVIFLSVMLLVAALPVVRGQPERPPASPDAVLRLPAMTVAGGILALSPGAILCGELYSRTFVTFTPEVLRRCVDRGPLPFVYAGWRIGVERAAGTLSCYTPGRCAALGIPVWFPGLRLAESESTVLGRDLVAQSRRCPAGRGGLLPADLATGILSTDACSLRCTLVRVPVYGFDRDDPDGPAGAPPQAVTADLPCGLPSRYVLFTFSDDHRKVETRIFRIVVFEQWIGNYWRFDVDQGGYAKHAGEPCRPDRGPSCPEGEVEPDLVDYPEFAAIPPFPSLEALQFDRIVKGAGTITGLDLGCKWPEMRNSEACATSSGQNRPLRTLLSGNFVLSGAHQGHGVLVVDGNLTVEGDLAFWGPVFVRGLLTIKP